jgi:hypothetical protein
MAAFFEEQPMTPKRSISLVLSCVLIISAAGCATILSGETQAITIHSTPPGAFVRLGYQTGNTPVTFQVNKGEEYPIEISQGPDKRLLPLHRRVDPMTFLNLVPPLWPGFIVDAATGAMTKYEPDVISVDFRTDEATQATHLTRCPY